MLQWPTTKAIWWCTKIEMYRNCTPLLPVLDTEWLCPRKNLGTINLHFDYVPENQGHSRLPKPSPKKLSPLTKTHSACNLGFIFDEHLTFSDQISTLSKSCYYHIRELCCISQHHCHLHWVTLSFAETKVWDFSLRPKLSVTSVFALIRS